MRATIVGAALDLGAGRRGVDIGPSAIRYAGLKDRFAALGFDCIDGGNVATAVAEAAAHDDPRARFLPEILATCERIAGIVGEAVDDGSIPIVLGGDHSIALGTLAGLASRHGPGAVVWFDAHCDLSTPETTPSGNVHGMPLAGALGHGGQSFDTASLTLPAVQPSRVAVIGARVTDAGEQALIGELGLGVHTMSKVDRRGIEAVVSEALVS
jgi:arginase